MIQVIFNGKKSYTDLHIIVESFSIGAPSKKKIKEPVPFMNGDGYDFSTVGSNGEMVYSSRPIKIRFNLEEKNRSDLWDKYSEALEWLLGTGQQQLIFTDMADCYYLAEVENAPSFNTVVKKAGIMEVDFIADPFKYGVSVEGSEQMWDTFNFNTDYMQDTEFDIIGSKTVQIYNPGRKVSPAVNCNANFSVTANGYTANFIKGDNNDWLFYLISGMNTIQITGTGHIAFNFRKEML